MHSQHGFPERIGILFALFIAKAFHGGIAYGKYDCTDSSAFFSTGAPERAKGNFMIKFFCLLSLSTSFALFRKIAVRQIQGIFSPGAGIDNSKVPKSSNCGIRTPINDCEKRTSHFRYFRRGKAKETVLKKLPEKHSRQALQYRPTLQCLADPKMG